MRLLNSITLLSLIRRILVSALTHDITVGYDSLRIVPYEFNVHIGDRVQFTFYGNNSVVQSAFSPPCQPLPGGFFSGFISSFMDKVAAPQKFIITIGDTQPIFFYCSQTAHCQGGMVAVINRDLTTNQSLVAYASAAAGTNPNLPAEAISPTTAPLGGILSVITTTTSLTSATTSIVPSTQSITPPSSAAATPSTKVSLSSASSAAAPSSVPTSSSAVAAPTLGPSMYTSGGTIYLMASSTADTPAEPAVSPTAASKGDAVCWDPGENAGVAFGVFVGLALLMV